MRYRPRGVNKLKVIIVVILVLAGIFILTRRGGGEIIVSEVIDGDTIRLSSGEQVRYIGIDTPETRKKVGPDFVWDPQPQAVEAYEFNRQLVERKPVRLEYDVQQRDRYNRLLAYVFCGEVFVNAELIRQGYALTYTFPPNVKYVDKFIVLQQEARQEKRGLWREITDEVISPDETGRYLGEIRIVEGRVRSTYKSAKVTFLNFGEDYKTDFTVAIFNSNLSMFEKRGVNPVEDYRNKKLRVYGRIKEYNGPEIIADNPAQIEVIK